MSFVLDPFVTKEEKDDTKVELITTGAISGDVLHRLYSLLEEKKVDHLLIKNNEDYVYFYDITSPFENKNYGK